MSELPVRTHIRVWIKNARTGPIANTVRNGPAPTPSNGWNSGRTSTCMLAAARHTPTPKRRPGGKRTNSTVSTAPQCSRPSARRRSSPSSYRRSTPATNCRPKSVGSASNSGARVLLFEVGAERPRQLRLHPPPMLLQEVSEVFNANHASASAAVPDVGWLAGPYQLFDGWHVDAVEIAGGLVGECRERQRLDNRSAVALNGPGDGSARAPSPPVPRRFVARLRPPRKAAVPKRGSTWGRNSAGSFHAAGCQGQPCCDWSSVLRQPNHCPSGGTESGTAAG
jgi:hypothetical protein